MGFTVILHSVPEPQSFEKTVNKSKERGNENEN